MLLKRNKKTKCGAVDDVGGHLARTGAGGGGLASQSVGHGDEGVGVVAGGNRHGGQRDPSRPLRRLDRAVVELEDGV